MPRADQCQRESHIVPARSECTDTKEPCDLTGSDARRSGIVNNTPSTPPVRQIRNDCQNGKPTHQLTITSPGRTKMIAESVPAADATVWTMLFSRIDESLTALRSAIEITAAGIDDAKVSPTL